MIQDLARNQKQKQFKRRKEKIGVKNKYLLLWALIFLLLINGLLPQTVIAAEEGNVEPGADLPTDHGIIFPEDRIQQAKSHGYEVQYSKYKPSRYNLEYIPKESSFFDLKTQWEDTKNNLINLIVFFIWHPLLLWDFMVITAVEKSFSLDIVDWFADSVEKAVQSLAGFDGRNFTERGIWGNFLLIFIICAGTYIAYLGMIKKKSTDALGAMIKSVVIIILSMAFFANAGSFMKYLNSLSSGLSQEVMGVGLTLNSEVNDDMEYPEEVASFVVADKLYHMLIYQPYLLLQYGKPKEDSTLTKQRVEKLLQTKRGSTARENVLKSEKNNIMMSGEGLTERLSLLILLSIFHLIIGFVFFIIAGAMLVYQFLFVILALYAPFALLMSLYPTWSQVATNWLKKFIGYQLTKLLLGIFMSVLVTLSQFLYDMAPPEKAGYFWTIAMQLILVVGIIWKRRELFSIVNAPLKVDADASLRNLAKKLDSYLGSTTQRIQKFTSRS